MLTKKYIEYITSKYKKSARACIERQKYELALEMVSNVAKIFYESNIKYKDDELELFLKEISNDIIPMKLKKKDTISDKVLFFDGFGFNNRGLAQIYLKALLQFKNIVYVTFSDRKGDIPDILSLLKSNDSEIIFIERKKMNFYNQIIELNEIICKYRPKLFMLYTTPYDVVSTTVLYAYEKILKRYQINLTDHAFWLGCNCIDYCIEFRNYGAYVSSEYRKIPKSNIIKLPFYPIIDLEKDFEGFPFEIQKNQKVVFSGGALYKTISEDNKYYKLLDKLLSQNEDVVFWYAGSGDDSQLRELMKKFPHRVFLTAERNDLYQILGRVCFYMSTYPICGGLMFQYAAIAGCVPITLKYDDISDEFLINQKDLGIEFKDEEALLAECEKLLKEKSYRCSRKKELKKAIIKEQTFTKNLKEILNNNSSNFIVKYNYVDTEKLKEEYLKRLKKKNICVLLASKANLRATIKVTPIKGIIGIMLKIIKK